MFPRPRVIIDSKLRRIRANVVSFAINNNWFNKLWRSTIRIELLIEILAEDGIDPLKLDLLTSVLIGLKVLYPDIFGNFWNIVVWLLEGSYYIIILRRTPNDIFRVSIADPVARLLSCELRVGEHFNQPLSDERYDEDGDSDGDTAASGRSILVWLLVV